MSECISWLPKVESPPRPPGGGGGGGSCGHAILLPTYLADEFKDMFKA